MKILFVINSLSAGGAERVLGSLANELSRRGHSVIIMLRLNNNREIKQEISDQIKVIDTKVDEETLLQEFPFLKQVARFWSFIQSCLPREKARLTNMIFRKRMKALVKFYNPDVVISFMVGSNIQTVKLLRGTSIPVIISERTDPNVYNNQPGQKRIRDKYYSLADGLVFQTAEAKEYFPPPIQKNSEVIANPVNLPARLDGSIPRNPQRIISVGRLVASKQFEVIIQAVEILLKQGIPCFLQIYGEGPLEDTLKELISKMGFEDRIHLMGYCGNIYEEIQSAGIFILASKFEGMPNALIESMGLGLAVIATDCPIGGPRELIRDGENGFLIPTADPEVIAEKIKFLLEHPAEAKRMGAKAEEIREKLSLERVTDQWEQCIQNVLTHTKKNRNK